MEYEYILDYLGRYLGYYSTYAMNKKYLSDN